MNRSIKQIQTDDKISSIYSSSKALCHREKIKKIQEGVPVSPTCIQVDLEAFCNDNCGFCTTRKDNGYNNEMLKLIQIERENTKKQENIDEFRPIGRPSEKSRLDLKMAESLPEMMTEADIPAIILTGGGEPTLWPKFDSLVKNLARNDIEIGLVTNGSNISKSRAKLLAESCTWIRFSMDASSQKTHRKVHRTPNYDFDNRIESVKDIVKFRNKKITIGISFIITPENKLKVKQSCQFYKQLKTDYIRFTWIYDKTGNAGLDSEEISHIKHLLSECKKEYDDENFEVIYENNRVELYSKPNNDFTKCHMQKFVWAIGANGLVYPCCIQKYNPGFEIGDINDKTFRQIIQDQHTLDKMNNLNPIQCNPCWLRNKNKIIDEAVNDTSIEKITQQDPAGEFPHANFV